jgi:hypothetical protein
MAFFRSSGHYAHGRNTLLMDYKVHFPISASLYWEDATLGSLLKLDESCIIKTVRSLIDTLK